MATVLERVETQDGWVERPVRVDFPVLVSFSSEAVAVRDYTLNLSEGGIFIETETMCPVGTRGTMKFRASQYDDPMSLEGEVVRVVAFDRAHPEQPHGLGIRFLDVSPADLSRLREIVDGARTGNVVDAIRRGIMESGRTLGEELRARPTDQKMMLALSADAREIEALIRDGTPSVLLRLLENPRLGLAHVATMLRSPKLNTRVLSGIKAKGRFLASGEARFLFCTHINTRSCEAMDQLRRLSPDLLRRMATSPQVRPQLRMRAQELLRAAGGSRPGRR